MSEGDTESASETPASPETTESGDSKTALFERSHNVSGSSS